VNIFDKRPDPAAAPGRSSMWPSPRHSSRRPTSGTPARSPPRARNSPSRSTGSAPSTARRTRNSPRRHRAPIWRRRRQVPQGRDQAALSVTNRLIPSSPGSSRRFRLWRQGPSKARMRKCCALASSFRHPVWLYCPHLLRGWGEAFLERFHRKNFPGDWMGFDACGLRRRRRGMRGARRAAHCSFGRGTHFCLGPTAAAANSHTRHRRRTAILDRLGLSRRRRRACNY
jgi:hypothetical protein